MGLIGTRSNVTSFLGEEMGIFEGLTLVFVLIIPIHHIKLFSGHSKTTEYSKRIDKSEIIDEEGSVLDRRSALGRVVCLHVPRMADLSCY